MIFVISEHCCPFQCHHRDARQHDNLHSFLESGSWNITDYQVPGCPGVLILCFRERMYIFHWNEQNQRHCYQWSCLYGKCTFELKANSIGDDTLKRRFFWKLCIETCSTVLLLPYLVVHWTIHDNLLTSTVCCDYNPAVPLISAPGHILPLHSCEGPFRSWSSIQCSSPFSGMYISFLFNQLDLSIWCTDKYVWKCIGMLLSFSQMCI